MTTLNRQRLSWDMSPATCRGVTDPHAGHRSAPGASECRSDREARCCPSRLRPIDLRRPFPPRRLRDERGEAWREPDHAVKRGANLIKITDVTGHKSLEMLKTYGRDAEALSALPRA